MRVAFCGHFFPKDQRHFGFLHSLQRDRRWAELPPAPEQDTCLTSKVPECSLVQEPGRTGMVHLLRGFAGLESWAEGVSCQEACQDEKCIHGWLRQIH